MNVSTKILKNNYSQSSQLLTINQTILNKYTKIFKKSKIQVKKIDDDISANQEEVLNWFFSLDISTRIKICSINNKFLVNIIYQMYVNSFLDPKIKFQLKTNNYSDDLEEIYPIIYTNNSCGISYNNVNNINNLKSPENSLNAYLNYFLVSNCVQTNINMSNFIRMNDIMEKEFLKEIKIFKINEYNDSMILSLNLISNENIFKKYFSYFTNDKYFTSNINPTYDSITKQFNIMLPEWVNKRDDYYTFCQIIIAYFEQIIMIWFSFYKNLDVKKFNDLLKSLNTDENLTNLLEDSDKVVGFLKKQFKNTSDKNKMLEELNIKRISTSFFKDKFISEKIGIWKKTWETISTMCYNTIFFNSYHDRYNMTDSLDDSENKFIKNFNSLNEEHFVESLLFTNLDKVYSYEDYFMKKVWDEIHNLYTRQNALDLINEEITMSQFSSKQRKLSYNVPRKSLMTTPKKNLRKNKKEEKRNEKEDMEKDDNLQVSHSQDSKNLKLNSSHSNTMKTTKIDYKKSNMEYIKTFLNNIIYKSVEKYYERSYNKISSVNIDADTDSYNISNKISEDKPSAKNKKEKNPFFLYTINPDHAIKNNKKFSTRMSRNNIQNNPNFNSKINANTESELFNFSPKNYYSSYSYNKDRLEAKEENKKFENFNKMKNTSLKENNYTKINPESNLNKLETCDVNMEENRNINITINSPVINNYYIINTPNVQLNSKSYRNSNENSEIICGRTKQNSFHDRTIDFNHNPPNNFPYHMYSNMNYSNNPYNFDSYSKHVQYNYLHNDILNYSRDVSANVFGLKGLKLSIIKKIEKFAKDSLNEFNICLYLYGSFATDLEIECSDIDITIQYFSKMEYEYKHKLINQSHFTHDFSIESVISKLTQYFTALNLFEVVYPIYTATVPVIKLQFNIESLLTENEKILLKNFRERENYMNYNFDKEELDKVKIDITFMDITQTKNNMQTLDSPSQKAVEYVKNSLLCFPEIRPLMHVLKRLLQLEKLNSSFSGGLSSFSLFLILLAFIKMRKLNSNFSISNLGNCLLEFLDFYSNFNFKYTFIDVNSSNPFIVTSDSLEQVPLILDPITYLNPAKNSYRIEEVKKLFIKTSNFIYQSLFNFNFSKETNKNIITSIFVNHEKKLNLVMV